MPYGSPSAKGETGVVKPSGTQLGSVFTLVFLSVARHAQVSAAKDTAN
jgi:hypothetical protein